MPQQIGRDRIGPLRDAGAQLVEVLPAVEYDEEHLPGSINIPLKDVDRLAKTRLDPARPVIVYCWDFT